MIRLWPSPMLIWQVMNANLNTCQLMMAIVLLHPMFLWQFVGKHLVVASCCWLCVNTLYPWLLTSPKLQNQSLARFGINPSPYPNCHARLCYLAQPPAMTTGSKLWLAMKQLRHGWETAMPSILAQCLAAVLFISLSHCSVIIVALVCANYD